MRDRTAIGGAMLTLVLRPFDPAGRNRDRCAQPSVVQRGSSTSGAWSSQATSPRVRGEEVQWHPLESFDMA